MYEYNKRGEVSLNQKMHWDTFEAIYGIFAFDPILFQLVLIQMEEEYIKKIFYPFAPIKTQWYFAKKCLKKKHASLVFNF